jgi:flagellin-like protein
LKGISPLIASVLLIAFTLGVAAVIGTWLASVSKTGTETVGGEFSRGVNCSGVILDIADAICHHTTNVTIMLHNLGSIPLTNPSFYMKTTNQTPCVSNQTDTIAGGDIKRYEINCTFPSGEILSFVRASALCEGTVSVYAEKSGFSESCS